MIKRHSEKIYKIAPKLLDYTKSFKKSAFIDQF